MKKLLAAYAALTLFALTVGMPAAHATTIALWTFEGGTPGTGATTVAASVGGIDGTANNGPTYVGGVKTSYGNQGLQFNGINQNVGIPTTGSPLELTGSFTIELGLINGTKGGFPLFMGGPLLGQDPYYIYAGGDGTVAFQSYFGGSSNASIVTGSGALTSGKLEHIAAVFDATGTTHQMRLYIDNVLVGSQDVGTNTLAYTDPGEGLWFGSLDAVDNTGWYDGIISDVRISDVALNPSSFFGVPEPAPLAILGFGLGALGLARRRRRRRG